jgi:hypothetical protein
MPTAPTHPASRGTRRGRESSGWLLAITGVALLVAAVVMMAAGS